MPYVVVESLKKGLDSRKNQLTSVVGTLAIAENVYINEGGEAQKRKAFVKSTNLFPADTFGLQDSDVGLETYGSIATPANLPSGITYVRLQHPTVLAGGSYNATYHAMMAVTSSTNFNGKAFVVAQFADLRKFLYYDGELVQDSANGLVMEGANDLTSLGQLLADDVNAIEGWLAHANRNNAEAVTAGNDLVFSPSGVTFTPEILPTSVSGLLTNSLIALDDPGVAQVRATEYFVITGIGAGSTVVITGPTTPTSGDSVTLASASFQGGDTNATFTARLAATMNSDYSQYGYTGESGSNKIKITAPVTWAGVDGNGIVITATYANCTVATTTAFTGVLAATLSTYYASFTLPNPNNIPYKVFLPAPIICHAIGGTASYTYTWAKISGDAISIGNANAASTSFFAYMGPGQSFTAYFHCTVFDGIDTVVTGTLTVTLFLPGSGPA